MFISQFKSSGFGLLLFFYSFAFCQEIQLNPMVVSATLNEQHLSEALSSVSYISRQQIEQSQATSLVDLLQGEVGFEFGRNGGLGSIASVFLRGQDSKNLAVYIDGVRAQVDQIGALQITDIPLAQIEKIEVLRGNASALYGDSAVGGVIQIFTRQGSGSPRPFGSLSMGGYGLREINTGYGGEVEDFKFNVQAGNTVSSGFSAMNTSQKTSANSDADSYMSQFFNLNLERKVGPDTAVGVRTNHRYYDNQYDLNSGSSTDTHNQIKISDLYVIYLHTKFSQDWRSNFDISSSKLSYEQFLNGSRNTLDYGYGLNEGQQKSVRWFNRYALDEQNTLNFGLDYSQDDMVYTGTVANADSYSMKRFARGYFLGATHTKDRWSVQVNVRKDVMDIANTDAASVLTSIAPDTVSGLVGLGYELDANWKLISSVSNGFSAPTAYDISQNTRLTPETFLSKELGLSYLTNKQMLRVVYFEMTTQNSVLYDDNSGLPYNTQSTENKGVETSYQAQWQSHRIKTSFVLQNPRSITYSEQLARRAKQYANLDISEQFEKYELGAAIYATAQRKDNHYNTEVLSPYALLSVYVAAPLDKNWTFRMRMDNAFDKDYQLAYGYNTPGRTLTATLSYQPK